MTIWPAYQHFEEDQKGSIEVGKKADLILLDTNLFEVDPAEIPGSRVLVTMFDGRIVHDVTWGLGDSEPADLELFDDLILHTTVQPEYR